MPPVTINLSPISSPQAYLNHALNYVIYNSLKPYNVSYGKVKSGVEIERSGETNSVVFLESSPPNKRTAPEGRPQQRWKYLFILSCAGTGSHVEFPSNFKHDRFWSNPPQSKLLQKVGALLGSGMSPAEQDSFKNGSNFSVVRRPPGFSPAAIIKPFDLAVTGPCQW